MKLTPLADNVLLKHMEAEEKTASGIILSTGGGCVTRQENYPLLHQNGIIIWLTRSIDALPTDGRPISQRSDMHALYAARKPLYERFCDIIIDNNGSVESTVESITEALK